MSTATPTLTQHIEIDPAVRGGRPRIAGTRITVADIAIMHLRMGLSLEEIAAKYELSPAAVYAAMSYYFDHRGEIDRSIEEDEAFVEAIRRQTPSLHQQKLRMNSIDEPKLLAQQLHPILERYKVRQAILFGSLAEGDATRRSDVDLIIVQDTDKRFFQRYEGILQEIASVVRDRDVDLLIYTPDELEQMSDRPFIREALSKGVIIYESEKESMAS